MTLEVDCSNVKVVNSIRGLAMYTLRNCLVLSAGAVLAVAAYAACSSEAQKVCNQDRDRDVGACMRIADERARTNCLNHAADRLAACLSACR